MANVVIMDDEPLSLGRLSKVLCDDRQHNVSTADNLADGVQIVENLGTNLDLLIIDVSMFGAAASGLLDLFAGACPHVKILLITPRLKESLREHYQLRMPFTDRAFVEAVDQVLAMRGLAIEVGVGRKSPNPCRSDRRAGSRARVAL
jgi:DNA-binding NtrC family response regulator